MNTTTRQAMKLQEIAGRIDSFATEQAAANAELVEAQERMRRFAEQRTNIEAEITSAAAKLETARVALAAAIEQFEPGDTEAAAVAAAKLTLVGLEERQVEKAIIGASLKGREIVLRIRPFGQIFGAGEVRVAERVTQRIGQLHALQRDRLAVQPLDEQVGRILVL